MFGPKSLKEKISGPKTYIEKSLWPEILVKKNFWAKIFYFNIGGAEFIIHGAATPPKKAWRRHWPLPPNILLRQILELKITNISEKN